jgi:hypothetical protein
VQTRNNTRVIYIYRTRVTIEELFEGVFSKESVFSVSSLPLDNSML